MKRLEVFAARLGLGILWCLLFAHTGMAQRTLTGRVTSSSGEPLPFANVYVKGTSKGTTTNIEGHYRLDLPSGPAEIVYRYLGFKFHVESIPDGNITGPVDVVLQPEQYTLGGVNIKADAEDPAYEIIRKAIAKRKFYLNQVDEFSCDVYIKGLQKITRHPKKFMGIEVDLSELVDSITGIAYLSESVSKYHFKKPNHVKEVMVSSKVSGSNKAFSFNQASDMEFNFYENIMPVEGLSERGFISPISSNALFYYRYRLDGTYVENGHTINKITVIPRRKNDPVFSGTIYIQDSTWRIHSTDLYLTRDAQIQFVDTLEVNQVFIPATPDESVWMVGSVTFRFTFSVFGFAGDGNFVGVYSNYVVNPGFEKKMFKGPVMKIEENSNKRDPVYWETIRPIPLTPEENKDYLKRDSLQVIRESKTYLDSIDRKSNKFKGSNLIYGYSFEDRYSKTRWSFSSPLTSVQFNTIEGLVLGMDLGYNKKFANDKPLDNTLSFHYGFANVKWNATASVRYDYKPRKFGYFRLSGGDDMFHFNEERPISPTVNTFYTLFAEKNYLKLYHKQFVHAETQYEIINGVRLTGGIEYAVRSAEQNNSDYSFNDKENRQITSNNPVNPANDSLFFERNESFLVHLTARIRFGQKYIDRPDRIDIIGSRWPMLLLGYRKGVPSWTGSDVDYDRMEIGIEDEFRLGMLGRFSYRGVYGKFLRSPKIYFMDYSHFNGNQTVFSKFEPNKFELLDYYTYSTTDQSLELFARHDFGGFILNKIPLVRKAKLNEIVGARYLDIPGKLQYLEISAGLAKLNLFRADVVFSFDQNGNSHTGWVIGLQTTLGN